MASRGKTAASRCLCATEAWTASPWRRRSSLGSGAPRRSPGARARRTWWSRSRPSPRPAPPCTCARRRRPRASPRGRRPPPRRPAGRPPAPRSTSPGSAAAWRRCARYGACPAGPPAHRVRPRPRLPPAAAPRWRARRRAAGGARTGWQTAPARRRSCPPRRSSARRRCPRWRTPPWWGGRWMPVSRELWAAPWWTQWAPDAPARQQGSSAPCAGPAGPRSPLWCGGTI
mmetsp:Transcript_36718/g.92805  ORF Transcript_36718/g.92805 Transcript_36718/m.92805 type:complete len:229 (-) Transcript_36718:1057-1743(-)